MRVILYPVMMLAGCGLVLSIAAHCMALAGVPVPGGGLVWGLHIGIFVVWIPTVFIIKEAIRNSNRNEIWKMALAGCPSWMRLGVFILFVYGAVNLAITGSQKKIKMDGNTPTPSVVRAFSGHWMIFYGAGFAVLYSRIYSPQLYRGRQCPKGHSVSQGASFCSECGYEFSKEPEST